MTVNIYFDLSELDPITLSKTVLAGLRRVIAALSKGLKGLTPSDFRIGASTDMVLHATFDGIEFATCRMDTSVLCVDKSLVARIRIYEANQTDCSKIEIIGSSVEIVEGLVVSILTSNFSDFCAACINELQRHQPGESEG